jgi:Protein of unknown function DUF262
MDSKARTVHVNNETSSVSDQTAIVKRFEAAQDRLVLQASDLSLETLASMVDTDAVDVRPHYQRRDRWNARKRSALIESFLLNIPVPPIYLAEDNFGQYSVIDGKQRLTAIRDFMRNDLALSELATFSELEEMRFNALPSELSNALQIRPYLRVVTLLRQSDPMLKYEVFERLNTGGESLNAQEIRNVAFQGPLNDLIYGELCDAPFLRRQLKIKDERSPAFRKMQDAEYVLRFLTLSATWRTFSGDFARSMDAFMEEHQNASGAHLQSLRESFLSALSWCERLWGTHAFNRPEKGGWRDQTLAGVFDAEMVAVALLPPSILRSLVGKDVPSATRELFRDGQFETAVRQGTNTPGRVRYRIDKMSNALRAIA